MSFGFIDTETRSRIPITHGTTRYATQVEVMIVTYAYQYNDPGTWDVTSGRPIPADLQFILDECDELWAHQSWFDSNVLDADRILGRIDPKRWRCSMMLALAHGLPGGLDKLGPIFQLGEDELKLSGKEYIHLFCKPNRKGVFNDRHSHPEEWKDFLKYATRDITTMQRVHAKCPRWNYTAVTDTGQRELRLWQLDQVINRRGFAADVAFAQAAVDATTTEQAKLAQQVREATHGVIDRATQRDRLLLYLLAEYNVALPNLKADTIERRLEDPELPEYVKELLRIRLSATKASTSKYRRILQMEVGGRMCGTLQMNGANRTGRWGGRGFQPQNLPRPSHKYAEIEAAIEAAKAGALEMFTDDVMGITSSALRSVVIAGPGKKLVTSDLSNIEGRFTSWLADEVWKLEAFAAFDRKEGPDLYKVSYGRSFSVDPNDVEDDSDERQIGKVQELSMGYQGGVNAYCTMAVTYGVDLEEMAEKAYPTIPRLVLAKARLSWDRAKQQKRTLGLSEKVYLTCDSLKLLWRAAHPETEAMWYAIENCAKNAILNPGKTFATNNLKFVRIGAWLYMGLPSGRKLCYLHPRVVGEKITYMGVNQYTKQWCRISTYGGKLLENAVQAGSRDVMADAMPRIEAAGFEIVLTVHDDVLSEAPIEREDLNDKLLSSILATPPAWATGLPLAAKGMTVDRWRK